MIGGRFGTSSRVALIAAAGILSTGFAAQAADLGGNCCADLEERVAELEATTVRKGNRVVSLEVSGQVNEAIMFWDVSDAGAENGSGTYIGTNNESRSRFRFKGSAKINADWSAGFLIEIGVRASGLQASRQDHSYNTSALDIRHEALYIQSKSLGTVWMGWTSSASDGITEICLGCGVGNTPDISTHNVAFYSATGDSIGAWSGNAGGFTGEGDRREIVKYISPTFAGFSVSAAWGQDDFWDAALRYAGEFGSIRVAAGVAYQRDTGGRFTDQPGFISATECNGNLTANYDCELIGASASIQHVPTGLYLTGAYGHAEDKEFGGENDSWYVTGGISQKWSSLGKTNFWGEYGNADNGIGANTTGGETGQLTWYGVGVQQSIDAAAMALYAHWKHFEAEGDVSGDVGTLDQFVAGAIIKF